MNKILFLFLIICFIGSKTKAQSTVTINDSTEQHIFGYGEIQYLEDRDRKFSFNDIITKPEKYNFIPSKYSTPQNYNLKSAYWYRIKIKYPENTSRNWILEFFDQTIEHITAYIPDGNSRYHILEYGASFAFRHRQFNHKNFLLSLKPEPNKEAVYYFRIQSHLTANIIVVLRSVNWFVSYAVYEYLLFGIFYGMIIVFAFYNFLMFLAIRQKQYVYYILYIISVGFYQLCIDGLAYQYIWPNSPDWNKYAYGVALCSLSVFALLFSSNLLNLKENSPKLLRIVHIVIGSRILYFLVCLIINKQLFEYKFIEAIPLIIAFYGGVYTWYNGFRAARFFVLGYGFIFLGFLIKILIMLDVKWLLNGALGYYSLNICFILEMVFLGFSMSDKVRILKKEKDKAQEERIKEFILNEQLKDTLNNKLEQQVTERTKEVIEKAAVIKHQNEELTQVNVILQTQSEEISTINALLEHDNVELKNSVVKVTQARIMSADVDFEEFSKIYPDRESCYAFLANLKWNHGYKCKKCNSDQYFNGHTPYSRRCRKCDYDESVMAYTVFQNSRIPITKAFYMIFLIYSSKGKLSSYKLADILSIRQSTCWSYSNKIIKLLAEKKKISKSKNNDGWSSIVLDCTEKN